MMVICLKNIDKCLLKVNSFYGSEIEDILFQPFYTAGRVR
jgi:hypothetical protein